MNDTETDVSVLVDRAVGGASIADGQLEIMLHRRLLYDDHRGVGEALNETVCNSDGQCEGLTVRGSFYINISPLEEAAQWRRIKGQQILMPVQLTFSVLEDGNEEILHSPSFSALKKGYELPQNIALMTLQEMDDGQVLLRLANIFEADECEKLSKTSTVDLSNLFPVKKIKGIVEVTLSANQQKSSVKKLKWNVEGNGAIQKDILRGRPMCEDDTNVEIAPMEIRTFYITL